VRHGKSAREKTETRVSSKTFRARAQRARRLAETAIRAPERHRTSARSEIRSTESEPLTLRSLSRYRRRADDYEIEIEGHHEIDGDTDIYAGK
jgi:hypothetical protein